MTFKEFIKLKSTKLLIGNSITWVLTILFMSLALWAFLCADPFPERFIIADMDKDMIKAGQATSLIKIYSLTSIFVASFISNIVMSSITLYDQLVFHNIYVKDKQDNELKTKKNLKRIILYSSLVFLIYVLYFLLGFIIIIYFWLIHIKANTEHLKINFIVNIKATIYGKKYRVGWILVFALWPIINFSSITTALLVPKRDWKTYLIPDANVQKYLTISNNKPNVFQFYFDRSVGILWNMLLLVDDIINPQNSFIKMFPEFTSYVNSLSLSPLTKTSNPTIYGGGLYNPIIKELNVNNWFNDKLNQNLTLDDWYFNALKSEIQMFQHNGIQNIFLNSLPYYRDTIMGGSNGPGNMFELEKDFKKNNINDVYTMINAKLSEKYGNYNIGKLELSGWGKVDGYVLEKYPQLIKFKNSENDKGNFFTFFSQQTHEDYTYHKNGRITSTKERNGLIFSMWDVIQYLKPIFNRLKQEPFYDSNNNKIGNVYDNSMISIISDHGTVLSNVSLYNDMLYWLKTKNYISDTQISNLLNFDRYPFNPVICIKTFKTNTKSQQNHQLFNTDQIVALSDLVRIYEIELNKLNNKSNSEQPFFLNDNNISMIRNVATEEIVRKALLLNPLDTNQNSIKNKKFINRDFLFTHTSDWRYSGFDKTFKLCNLQVFIFDKSKDSIFHNEHFTKY